MVQASRRRGYLFNLLFRKKDSERYAWPLLAAYNNPPVPTGNYTSFLHSNSSIIYTDKLGLTVSFFEIPDTR